MRAYPRSFQLLLVLFLLAIAPLARAQRVITLGNSTAPLDGLWKFHIGDDMAWAQPEFDDSAWGTMDLTPPPGSYDPALGSSGFVPGWTARGYKGVSGYAWYRLRVDIRAGSGALALKMPDSIDDAYQVYVNGQRIGEFGRFTERGVTAYNTQPRAFALPASFQGGMATVAIRLYMYPFTPLIDPDAGGLHAPPLIGEASSINALLNLDWESIDRTLSSIFLEGAILLLALLVAFGLSWLDRTEFSYLWLGFTCLVVLGFTIVVLVVYYTTWIDGVLSSLLLDAFLEPVRIGLWVIFWASWFRLGGIGRLHRTTWTLVLLLTVTTSMLRPPLCGSLVPAHASVWLSPLALALKLLLGVVLVWVTIQGIRKNRVEGWLALPAVLLVFLALYQAQLSLLHVPTTFFPYGVSISVGQAGTILSTIIVTVLLLRRFLRAQREQAQWKLEIEQAREVQQMLIPEELPKIPWLAIESEFRPARVVGGDFFQIIPDSRDGSVLIVAGDVAGHGLQAGMLVSFLVGAIRNQTDTNFDPMEMLQTLNRRLCGRGQAHATCLALRIEVDGAATLANAGHLPPYLNGRELPMEGAMLLGMVEEAEFSVMRFELQPGDTLMLLSDGIAEAQDERGKLFGFERIREMLRGATPQEPVKAADLATAAQNFGQQDDITVLSVTRTAVYATLAG